MRDEYDYIIAGAGSAGSVLAYRLSEDKTRNVLLVESGPRDRSPLIHVPFGLGRLMKPGNPHCWDYMVSHGSNRGEERWLSGRTLGGSSSINGMVYVRGAPADYDGWEALGCKGWGWEKISRCFTAMEDHQLGTGNGRGVGGPLRITQQPAEDEVGHAFLAACGQSGIPVVSDINAVETASQGRFGWQPQTVSKGRRVSAATAFIAPAKRRPNLDVVTETDVLSINFDNLVAKGVLLRHRGVVRSVGARAEVILAAGALNSPKILQLSGIGPAPLLRKLGIKVLVDAPDVGQNLIEHRVLHASYRLKRGGNNTKLQGFGLIRSIGEYIFRREGPLAGCVFSISGFVKTEPGLESPDGMIGLGLQSLQEDMKVDARPGMTLYSTFLHPQSKGEIKIRSADPHDTPCINANYMAEDSDRKGSAALFRMMRKIAAQPALASFIEAEISPGTQCGDSDEDIIEASFSGTGGPGYHPSGTCRMGTDSTAVLDPELRVRGVQKLRVVDTSIMPTIVSGNTNGPAMAIAWNAADMIMQP